MQNDGKFVGEEKTKKSLKIIKEETINKGKKIKTYY